MKNYIILALFLVVLVLCIKFVPPVRDLAREHLPAPVLNIIGEKPYNALEKGIKTGIDAIKSATE